MPRTYGEVPGNGKLPLLEAMMLKNDFDGLPAECIYDGDDLIAIAVVGPDFYPLYAKLWVLEVAERYRGKGLGTELIKKCLFDYDDIKLVAMRPAFEFYKKCGFVFTNEPDPKSNVGYMVSRS